MNIAIENLFNKVSKTLILLILVSMITYSLYNILSYKPVTYYKSVELIKPTVLFMEDSSELR